MDELGRAWRRRALAAGGAAVIAPVAMVGATLAVGFGGGGGPGVRLDAISQAFSGPEAPSVERPVPERSRRARAARRRDPEELLAALTPEARRSRPRTRPAPPTSGSGPAARPPATRTTRGGPPQAGGTPPAAPPAAGSAPPGPTPSPSPSPSPGPVGQAGDEVGGLVEPIPVLGPPAAGLTETVTGTVDGALPVP
ncbi:MAG TPA: hypothetical protein VF533_16940 [Solirubrobacteraceae bacterium]